MSTRYRTTYHGILLGLLLHVIMAQAVNAQRSLSERLDYFRSLGERNELELEEIRTPIVSYQTLMDSITQRILTEQCGHFRNKPGRKPSDLTFGLFTVPKFFITRSCRAMRIYTLAVRKRVINRIQE